MESKLNEEFHKLTLYHSLSQFDNKKLKTGEEICPRQGVRILTYNIFLRPPPLKNNEDDYKNERLEDFCKVIYDFDIICLQEMFGTFNTRKHDLIRAAVRQGFFFYIDTPTPSLLSQYVIDGGLLILCRFPIIESCFYPFTYGVLADSLSEKGILYAKIQIGDQFLHLMTTHLQASYLDSTDFNWKVSFETRANQLSQINKIVKEIMQVYYNNSKEKIMLVGDLNTDAQRYKFQLPANFKNLDQLQQEYDTMIDLLCDSDIIFRDFFPYYNLPHPITYGEFKDEEILTYINDRGSKQTIDYIFEIFMGLEDEADKDKNKRLYLDSNTAKVEKFFITDYNVLSNCQRKQRVYRSLSDHYGLSIELKFKKHTDIGSEPQTQNDYFKHSVIDVGNEDEVKLIIKS